MKDETLLPENFSAAIVKLKNTLVACNRYNYCSDAIKDIEDAFRCTIQSGNSAQPEPVNKTYKLPPNSFSDDELMGMAHGDNPAANAYRELLEFRRNAANGNPGQPVTVPDGYVLVPVEPTPEILATITEAIKVMRGSAATYSRVLAAAPKAPDGWIPVSERMPDPESERRVCVYTPTSHEDMRYRFVPASLFKVVCRDATHWHYMTPPDAPKVKP